MNPKKSTKFRGMEISDDLSSKFCNSVNKENKV